MITANDVQFGRLTPPQEKMELHATTYRYGAMIGVPLVTASLEKVWPLPELFNFYNQQHTNACTGFGASWMSSIHNRERYDATWLYHEGQMTDGDPATTPERDNGGYVWAVMDVLRKAGHVIAGESVVRPEHGIQSYGWVHTVDELRTAFSAGPVVFGLPWYSEFMTPRTVKGEFWIGTRQDWGQLLGGHAICGHAYSDQREAVRLVNSWGEEYPPVWISFNSISLLLAQRGECAAPVDRTDTPPEPPVSDVKTIERLELEDEDGSWYAENVRLQR